MSMSRRLLGLESGNLRSLLKVYNWEKLGGTKIEFNSVYLELKKVEPVYPVPYFANANTIFVGGSDDSVKRILHEYAFPCANKFYLKHADLDLIKTIQNNFECPKIYSHIIRNSDIEYIKLRELIELLNSYDINVELK